MLKSVVVALALILSTLPARAQEPYTRMTLSVKQADVAMAAAVGEAERRGLALAIVIVDEAGNIVLSRRMDGALPQAFELARRKAATAALIRNPTKLAQERFAGGDNMMLAIPGMLPLQGGLPIKHGDLTIGAIAASGSPPPVDEAVAQAGLGALHPPD